VPAKLGCYTNHQLVWGNLRPITVLAQLQCFAFVTGENPLRTGFRRHCRLQWRFPRLQLRYLFRLVNFSGLRIFNVSHNKLRCTNKKVEL